MSQPEIGAGDVKIDLVDHGEVTLRPTLDACRRLSSGPGGINKMVERCKDWEFEAILAVITAGLGRNSKELPDLIFKTGMLTLAPACIDFLFIISNGGRALGDTGESGESKDPLEKSSL